MVKIVGIIGAAGSGKTLVAEHLVQHYAYTRTRFAAPLKRMLKAGLGLTDEQLDGHEKMTPIPALNGVTPRQLMQTLGTEWGRRRVDPNLWVKCWKRDALSINGDVVVDDVRFPNEAAAVKQLGGTLWRVYRPGLAQGEHVSEKLHREIKEDRLITNASTIDALIASVDTLVEEL